MLFFICPSVCRDISTFRPQLKTWVTLPSLRTFDITLQIELELGIALKWPCTHPRTCRLGPIHTTTIKERMFCILIQLSAEKISEWAPQSVLFALVKFILFFFFNCFMGKIMNNRWRKKETCQRPDWRWNERMTTWPFECGPTWITATTCGKCEQVGPNTWS